MGHLFFSTGLFYRWK